MKEISLEKKLRVIKLFLKAYTYKEISQRESIAQSSVVNIVDEFRNGQISIPPDMVEYIDELRKLAVDLRKSNTGIAELKSYLKLHKRLMKLGANTEDGEQWLVTCQTLTQPGISTNQLISAATELSQISSEIGLTYSETVQDFHTKKNELAALNIKIEQVKNELNEVTQELEREKDRYITELDSIRKAIATARTVFEQQKHDLKARLNEYLVSNKLKMEKVEITIAVLELNLEKTGLKRREREDLAKQIREVGLLSILTRQLNKRKIGLQSQVNTLKQYIQEFNTSINELTIIEDDLKKSEHENRNNLDQLRSEIELQETKLANMEQAIQEHTRNLYISWLIVNFLFEPGNLKKSDFDRLVNMMISVRQSRLGISPKQVTDSNGNIVCECQLPTITSTFNLSEITIDNLRVELAHMLTPLVMDKFVSRFDYDIAKTKHIMDKGMAVLNAKIEVIKSERERYLF